MTTTAKTRAREDERHRTGAIAIARAPKALERCVRSHAFARAMREAMTEAGARASERGARASDATDRRARAAASCEATPKTNDFGTHARDVDQKSRVRMMRSVMVTNTGDRTVACVHCRVEPASAGRFFQLVDAPGALEDAKGQRYAAIIPSAKTTNAARCVAESLPLRVEFSVDSAEDGLNCAWILAACVPEEALREAESGERTRDEAADILAKSLFVTAAYVSAVVRKNGSSTFAWDVDAVPFIPSALRGLFNASELMYPYHMAWRHGRTPEGMNNSQLETLCKLVSGIQKNPVAAAALKHWVMLLRLEQSAQQQHLENVDMFHVNLVRCDAATSKRLFMLPSVTLRYSSKHLKTMSFYSIHVPGMSDGRPMILAGDVVYVRPSKDVAIEFSLVVEYVSNRDCMIYVKFDTSTAPFNSTTVHVRFTLNKQIFALYHQSLAKTLSIEQFPPKAEKTKLSQAADTRQLKRFLPGCDIDEQTKNETLDAKGKTQTYAALAVKNSNSPQLAVPGDKLNAEQRAVVEDIFRGAGLSRPYIIWGPPGTGKTLTVVESVVRLLAGKPTCKILMCAPAPFAADILCSRLADRLKDLTPSTLVRVHDQRRLPEQVKDDVRRFSLGIFPGEAASNGESPFAFYMRPDGEILKDARVVVCSCTSASLLEPLSKGVKDSTQTLSPWIPTHIFVDEAAQALVPETLIPLTLADSETSVILVGDPKQLGPTVHSFDAARQGLRKSLLEIWMDHDGMKNGTQLRLCYRSHPDIVSLPSRLFYDNSVLSVASKENVALPNGWDEFKDRVGNGRSARCLFYGVKGKQRREGNTSSWTNPLEAEELVSLVFSLIERTTLTEEDVCVMATYRRQVILIRNGLRERGLGGVRVGTVDDMQGQESKICFLSTVVTAPKTLQALDPEIGFLNNPRRFNVAISRAKALNIVIGHPLVLIQNPLWNELLRECVSRDAYRGSGSEYLPAWARAGPKYASSNDADLGFTDGTVTEDLRDFEDIASAIAKTAELSLLGIGGADNLPDAADVGFDDFGDEPAWRVAI